MLGRIIVALINLWIHCANLWRALWRRRVDYVQLRLSGAIAEFADQPPLLQRILLRTPVPLSVAGLRRISQRISADPQVRGVLLEIDGLQAGWATVESLRAAVADLRASGKHVVAYLVTSDIPDMLVACAAERILMPPSATWNVLGIHAEATFLRDTLARWGVSVEAIAVSPYKSAPDIFTRTDFSPESRAQYERLIDTRFRMLLELIAAGRNLTIEQVAALIDQAPLTAEAARAAGLVNTLAYADQLTELLGTAEQPAILRPWPAANKALRLPLRRYRKQQIGLIRVEGSIGRGTSRRMPLPMPLLGERMVGSDSVAQALRQAEQNPRIAAVVLYIDSPGGDSYASDLIWREVLRLRTKKPVVVCMGEAAASGGYYIAAPASQIIARPSTVTGSIGVFSLRPVLAEALEQQAIHTTIVRRGAHAGLLTITQPLQPQERAALVSYVNATYGEFTNRVAEGRAITADQVEQLAGGRVWLGSEAQPLNLVDQLGGIPEAVAAAQQLASLPPDPLAPLMLLTSGNQPLPPAPFPPDPASMVQELTSILQRTRAWALVPFEITL